ncbi:MAG TPA: hypothetical protein VGR14_15660 [Verrucomicrobiae bacterium]|nr:hypothetical protein [Verrucomicrobiae bacterium]
MVKKSLLPMLTAMLSLACVPTGCKPDKAGPPAASSAALLTRNNCYSLLHQLLDEQKDVSILRFIKKEHSDVKNLVQKIAAASGAASALLEDFAKHDPGLTLDDIGLPLGETATRDAIAWTEKKELLGHTGHEFELDLLLTQIEALSYASHLAKIAGENDSQSDRAHALAAVSKDMENLHQEVFVMLLSKRK